MSREDERRMGTADLARRAEDPRMDGMDEMGRDAAMQPPEQPGQPPQQQSAEPLAALFQGNVAEDFRHRWDAIQIGFVDDPQAAVRNADELVAQVLRTLAESFADQRSQIDAGLAEGDASNTEGMRIALQRYRSFFQRLLSL